MKELGKTYLLFHSIFVRYYIMKISYDFFLSTKLQLLPPQGRTILTKCGLRWTKIEMPFGFEERGTKEIHFLIAELKNFILFIQI